MELELGLAIPSYFPIKSSDLNGNVDSFDDNFSEMKNDSNYINHKSNFSAANSDYDDSDKFERKTLPLLIWNGQPNDEEEDDHPKRRTFEACNPEIKEENQLVGWPPIKSWRKKQINGINHQGIGWNTNERINNDVIGRRNSMYVKVKMEGVAIGRKINLRLYNSYQVLTNSLIQMFAKYQNCNDNGTRFTLLYQDREGDWMLAGDVPWQTFMETVQRIQILRNGKRGRINSRKSSDIS
ncbi:auxin-responsive protein IAA28 isoform X2 [Nicotiana tabacum]|uniref:Auxin-responsive protein n=1 Tax=Nicotiana tabacum TaxID=4097 RepID=A0A1S3X7T4_TOBAC|nr:auxin-responsive protein IAA28-like isoform X2 [Nicotiana tomentosiformis]XP_016436075.1 PREDICTED: auxin-responsive protein IAA28-like isoform X2 [Nicotiana tabacum]